MRRVLVAALAVVSLATVAAVAVPVGPAGGTGPVDGPPSGVATVASADSPLVADAGPPTAVGRVVAPGNVTAYLAVPPVALETTGYRRAPIDATGAVALDATTIEARLAREAADERFAGVESPAARRAAVRASAAGIEARIAALRGRQGAAIRSFNSATTAERLFLRELALIDAAADDLAAAIDRIETRAGSVPDTTVDGEIVTTWARDRRLALAPLRGPVRDRLAETIDSEVAPPPIYVETTEEGIVLAGAFNGRYYRQVVLPAERTAGTNASRSTTTGAVSNRTPSIPSNVTPDVGTDDRTFTDIADALDRVSTRYPGAWRRRTSIDSTSSREMGVSQVTLFHDRGRLTVALDRETGAVFAEQQRIVLAAIPTPRSTTNTTDALELTVNRTYPTGPLEIGLTEPVTDDPINGTVTVNGVSVGDTGPNGGLWTIQPRGAFTVVARNDNESVRVTINDTAGSTRRTPVPGASDATPPAEETG